MVSEISIIEGIFTIIGSASGLIALSYLALRKFRRRIRVFPSDGIFNYFIDKKKSSRLAAEIEITIHNGKDESISITDIVGTLKYSKDKIAHKQNVTELFFSEKPKNFDILPINIDARQSARIRLNFEFLGLDYSLIDRKIRATFFGFLGKVPVVISDEREYIDEWETHPLRLLLSVHVNGDRLVKTVASLLDKRIREQPQTGTLGVIDVKKIEKDFWDEKHFK